MKIQADFVTSAAGASGFPGDDLPQIALVGRSNVGKSSLINALARQRIARASAAPGKTRLANVYRVRRGSGAPFYLVDLPGYGYARGGEDSAREFEALTRAFFGSACGYASGREREARGGREASASGSLEPAALGVGPRRREERGAPRESEKCRAALLLVDARHPGLDNDLKAWAWLKDTVANRAIVATKIDTLPRGQRIRALRELESVFDTSVLPVSAVTGEGLDELWNQIDRLANSLNPQPRRSRNHPNPPRATAARPPKK